VRELPIPETPTVRYSIDAAVDRRHSTDDDRHERNAMLDAVDSVQTARNVSGRLYWRIAHYVEQLCQGS
jgi:hypothetical protein